MKSDLWIWSLALGDFDDDGDLDVAAPNSNTFNTGKQGMILINSTQRTTGDFNLNGQLDVSDVNILITAISQGTENVDLDLNGDDMVSKEDLFVWIRELKNSWFGDANLDGQFDSGDLVEVFRAGKYELPMEAGWEEGDWNGDQRFDSGDLIAAFQDGGYEIGSRAAVSAVPEPTCGDAVGDRSDRYLSTAKTMKTSRPPDGNPHGPQPKSPGLDMRGQHPETNPRSAGAPV